MNRREALKRTFYLTGYTIAASTTAGVLAGCKADVAEGWVPALFDKEQLASIAHLAEAIIPKTDTPGAKDVKVERFIDSMVKEFYSEEERNKFMAGLKSAKDFVIANGSKLISKLDAEGTKNLMEHLISNAKAEDEKNGDDDEAPAPFFKQLKNLSMLGYFTSEEVCNNVLVFDPIPGDYDGNYPLEKTGGRAWAI